VLKNRQKKELLGCYYPTGWRAQQIALLCLLGGSREEKKALNSSKTPNPYLLMEEKREQPFHER